MQNLKRHLSLVFALGFATLASVSVYRYLKEGETVAQAKTVPVIPVVVAKHDLPMGTRLMEEDFVVENWLKELATEQNFHSTKPLIGRILRSPLAAYEPVLESKLMKDGENLSSLIPPHMRGVTVQIPRSNALGKMLERESVVDVIAIIENGDSTPATKVIVQAAHVLAVHSRLEKPESDRDLRQMEVTLVVTPREAEWLVMAMNKGAIQLVVRNGDRKD